MKIGDRVKRKWRPTLGEGIVLHILADKIVVRWPEGNKPTVRLEKVEHLKPI